MSDHEIPVAETTFRELYEELRNFTPISPKKFSTMLKFSIF